MRMDSVGSLRAPKKAAHLPLLISLVVPSMPTASRCVPANPVGTSPRLPLVDL